MKKILLILFILCLIFLPLRGEAFSKEELLLQIEQLQEKIKVLQQKIEQLERQKIIIPPPITRIPDDFRFTKNLAEGKREEEVRYLQIILNKDSETRLADKGVGSLGNETNYFGPLTKGAVIKFQEKYSQQILEPWGFAQGTGMVGPTTRAKLNELLLGEGLTSGQISIFSLEPQPGDTIVVRVKSLKEGEKIVGEFGGKEVEFYSLASPNEKIAILPVGSKWLKGNYPLTISSNLRAGFSTVVRVKERSFLVTKLEVTPKLQEKGYSPTSIEKSVAQENKIIFSEVISQPISEFYFKEKYTNPLEKMIEIGAYGNIRKSEGVTLQHLGVDLEAEERTPVFAINEGVVRFTRETNSYGKTVILDHGGGIRSLYLHLAEYLVKEGDRVKRGEKIALSGNTGYSITPHLHLSINVQGESIDPLRFLKTINENL